MTDLLGYVDKVSMLEIKGWAYDPDSASPVAVRAVLDGEKIAEGVADIPRPSLDRTSAETMLRGYRLPVTLAKNEERAKVVVSARKGVEWIDLPLSRALKASIQGKRKPKKAYQDFDGTGSSRSYMKLESLRLDRINGGSFDGLAVLDIGCNEGFFCREALRRGASGVVGIDSNRMRVDSAKERVPGAEFINDGWFNLPERKFDVIFFLSAIHYEKDQKTLLRQIHSRLQPGGTLILECGIAEVTEEKWFKTPGPRGWHTVMRHDGLKRYPTYDMLTRELLSDYAVRPVGRSVDQGGDPVPRWVLHCSPKVNTAILIAAPSGAGKTSLSFDFDSANFPCYRIDPLLSSLVRNKRYSWSPLSKSLRENFDPKNRLSLGIVADAIVDAKLENELVDLIFEEMPREAYTFVIEGEALCRPSIMNAVVTRLRTEGIRPWTMRPAFEPVDRPDDVLD